MILNVMAITQKLEYLLKYQAFKKKKFSAIQKMLTLPENWS
jgi:hypothetical protein